MSEHESMTEVILAPLKELQSLAQNLFLSLGLPASNPPPTPSAATLLACDASIAAALQQARVHQIKQRRIEKLKQEVLGLERRLVEVWIELEQGKRDLAVIVEDGEKRMEEMEKAKNAAVPYPTLLAYASSLSSFTSAPPGMPETSSTMAASQTPLPLFYPPFPTEEKMRRGRLNAELPLGIVGETHSIGHEPSQSPPGPVLPLRVPGTTGASNAVQHVPASRPPPPPQGFDLFDLDLNPDL